MKGTVSTMSIVKRGGWVLIGVFLGVLATTSISAVKHQPVDEARLKTVMAMSPLGIVYFVRDTKSDGCWIVFNKDAAVSVATAPAASCQFNDGPPKSVSGY